MRYLLHKVVLWDNVEALAFSLMGHVEREREPRLGVKWEGALTSILDGRTGLNIKPLSALNSPASFGGLEK